MAFSVVGGDEVEAKTYTIEPSGNETAGTTTIKIQNDLETDDAVALVAFFVFMLTLIVLGLCVYYGSGLRLWFRQTCLFPCRRLCCEGERKRLWALHKDAVIRSDASGAARNPARTAEAVELGESPGAPMASAEEDDPLEAQLDTLVGLEPLKDEIRALRRTLVVEQQRAAVLGSKRSSHRATAPHMVFRGSPGTGKTHAARLIARLLKELGYVHGEIVEVQRADLVAGYVGQTALKTRAVINKAKGGVLFVDEAYALAPGGAAGVGRDFGAEAIQELMRDLTSGDPVVVLAGYPDEMERFLRVNPGLSRRFQVRFNFPDYSLAQLAQIFGKIAARHGYRLGPDASLADVEAVLANHFTPALCRKWNGGLPEGLFRRSQDALAKRLNVLTLTAADALTLTLDDVLKGARILAATLDDPGPRRPQQQQQQQQQQRQRPQPRPRAPPAAADDDDDALLDDSPQLPPPGRAVSTP
mmetsp:Transcript_8638/g.27106  ORF Transcript_8638/g.27106 Transcript_8638/m.27106 type:complete len:472 (+) Transcript_8638:25-1440(+)